MRGSKTTWVLILRVSLMAGAAAAIGLAFWNPLRSEVQAQTKRITTALARSLQNDILDEIRYQMLDLVRLANLLGLEPRFSRTDWQDQTKLFMKQHPGYVYAQWMDARYQTRWTVSSDSDEKYNRLPSDSETEQALRGLANPCPPLPRLLPKFRFVDGNTGRQIVVPICRHEESIGFFIATIDERRVLAEILADDTELGYGIAVLDDGENVFSTPGINAENDRKWGQIAHVPLVGANWIVRVWPESDMLQRINSPLPEQALLMGAIIGLLVFTTLDFARSSHLKSRELRLAHDELESRVEKRTAELQQANKELGNQILQRRRAEESLQDLSGRLLNLRDEEQRRIARELHDSTVQVMGAVAIDLEKIQQIAPSGGNAKLQSLIADASELVERATAELRTMSYLLHPPILDDLGLDGALPWYASGFSTRSGIKVTVDLPSNLGRMPHEVELTLFRIVQEALTNIHRHSGSATAEIILRRDGNRVHLKVADHGKGVQPELLKDTGGASSVVGVGVAGMRERVRQLGGQFSMESSAEGTALSVELTIANSVSASENVAALGNAEGAAQSESSAALPNEQGSSARQR